MVDESKPPKQQKHPGKAPEKNPEGILPPPETTKNQADTEEFDFTPRGPASAGEWKATLRQELDDATLDSVLQEAIASYKRANGRRARKIDRARLDPELLGFADIFARSELSKKDLERAKQSLTPSERTLVDNLQIYSIGSGAAIRLDKLRFAQGIKHRVEASGEPEVYSRAVYFGSADDVELPMLAGVQNVTLVDPGFSEKNVDRFMERVRKSYDANAHYDAASKRVKFTFDNKPYTVELAPETMADFNARGEQADIVVLFNKEPGMTVAEAKRALRPGGLYFDNREGHFEEPVTELPAYEQREEASPLISTINPIQESGELFKRREQIPTFVEAPLVEAVEHLYDKNIRTFMSSANKKDIGREGWISIDFSTLSDENRRIIEKIGYINKEREKHDAHLRFPIGPEDTAASVSKKAMPLVEQLQEQRATWIPRFTLEEIGQIYRIKPGDARLTIEGVQGAGYVYDPKRKVFFYSTEHLQKFDESEKKFGK